MDPTTTVQMNPIFLWTLWKSLSRSVMNHGEWFIELNILIQQLDKLSTVGPFLKLLPFSPACKL